MSNPFDNPWQKNNNQAYNGPVYGNAYEDDTNQGYYNAPMSMPNPQPVPGYTNEPVNAWGQAESNKTQYEPPVLDAYQYSGTAYGNQSNFASNTNAYSNNNPVTPSPQPAHLSTPQPEYAKPIDTPSISNTVTASDPYRRPNKWRVLLRFIMFICSVGHLGFAAGARPVSCINSNFIDSNFFCSTLKKTCHSVHLHAFIICLRW